MAAASQLSPSQRWAYDEEGHLVVRGASGADGVRSLLDAIERLMDRALVGECEIAWIDEGKRLPARNGGLLRPEYFDQAFVEWLDEDVIHWLEAILETEVRYSRFGMLGGGGGQLYQQAWHRDLVDPPGEATEQQLLDWFAPRCVQYNAPLQPADRYLQIIPGSHCRASTPQEMKAWNKNPLGDMPGMITLHVEPGDIVFYNPNLWHRGWNPQGNLRWTMHCANWRADVPPMVKDAAQRQWFLTPGFLDKFPPRSRRLVERFLAGFSDDQLLKPAELALASKT